MRILIEFVLTFLLALLALKFGWPWPILFIVGYLIAFDLKLPFLSKRTKVQRRFLAFLAIFITVWFSTSWLIGRFLFADAVQSRIASSDFWPFLLTPDVLKVLWAAALGSIVPLVLSAFILLPYGFAAAQNMYSQYDQYKGHEWEAAQTAISGLLGIGRGTWIVSDGKAEVRGNSGGSLARFGGPGILIVQEGHAVILEISGKLSRVGGRGIIWLKPFERISMVVPLNSRVERITVEQVATKDKVLIEEFAVIVFHKIDPGPEDERIQDGQFAYTEQKLLDGVWSPGGDDWRNTVKSITDGAVRDVVGRYDLEEIMPMSDKDRERFKDELRRAINKVTENALGVLTFAVDIGPMKVPDEARKRLMEKWLADWSIRIAQSEREAMIRKGEAEAVIMKIKEIAWAQAQKQVIEEITAGFRTVGIVDGIQAPYILALRSLETLEKMAGDPATKILLPNDVVTQLRDLRHIIQETTPLLPR